jgi:hypothetical protein
MQAAPADGGTAATVVCTLGSLKNALPERTLHALKVGAADLTTKRTAALPAAPEPALRPIAMTVMVREGPSAGALNTNYVAELAGTQ